MDINTLETYLGPDWQILSCLPRIDGGYRISGVYQGCARVLHLLPLPDGFWRCEEQGQSWLLSGPLQEGSTASGAELDIQYAPMDGLLCEVAVSAGVERLAGQVLYTLESMKMQIQICAPCAGQVVALVTQPGTQVRKGQEILKWKGHAHASR